MYILTEVPIFATTFDILVLISLITLFVSYYILFLFLHLLLFLVFIYIYFVFVSSFYFGSFCIFRGAQGKICFSIFVFL